jgi:hypothetical protein
MADKADVAPVLYTHDRHEGALCLASEEDDAVFDLTPELAVGHIGLVPAIIGNDALVCDGRIIDDFPDDIKVVLRADSYHGWILPVDRFLFAVPVMDSMGIPGGRLKKFFKLNRADLSGRNASLVS